MTQMLLFSPTSGTTTTTATNAWVADADPTPLLSEPQPESQNIAEALEHDGGLHHMGDLARLVLLRYDLVAQRRAAMAARKAAK